MSVERLLGFSALFLALVLAACAPVTLPPAAAPASPEPTSTAAASLSATPAATPTSPPAVATPPAPASTPAHLAPVPPSAEPVVGEVPADLKARIAADVEMRAGRPATDLELIRAEAITWSDGSLGCPQPGAFYTQALVDGYWIVWRASDGREWDYRATQRGTFILCENAPLRPAEGGPAATVTPISP
jgi:hypothetical protein